MTENPYLKIVYQNLPRLLALYNNDESDRYYGCGDRQFWAWKLIDFPNATFQGAAFGLALLYHHKLLPEGFSREVWLERIFAMIDVLPQLMDRRGGLAEVLPNEGSFCVTGLVLADVLGALMLLKDELHPAAFQRRMEICRSLAEFLKKQDEYHGIISNHLATSALGLIRWGWLTGDKAALLRAAEWLRRIKENADAEGWMSEYGGADPGYQSWCCSALAQIQAIAPEFDLEPLLKRGYAFLAHFAMPDGSFANAAGSRMTRFLFAGGAEMMQEDALAAFARRHITRNDFVNLNAVDAPNLAPFFNDTVLAAVYYNPEMGNAALPWQGMQAGDVVHFEKAGLLLHRGAEAVTLVSITRGGYVVHVPIADKAASIHAEPFGAKDGKLQRAHNGMLVERAATQLVIRSELWRVERMWPTPFQFILLRILSLTAFRSQMLGNRIKRMLVTLLLQPAGRCEGSVIRRINLATGDVRDEVTGSTLQLSRAAHFSPRHMASQGYWQASDEASGDPAL